MKIKIAGKNEQRIRDALRALNGTAESFSITRPGELSGIARVADNRLVAIPKRAKVCVVVDFPHA
ncbi:MAG: hypothetical protein ACE368_22535 [Paracoccaceae bacterium]